MFAPIRSFTCTNQEIGLRWLPPVLHFPEPLNFTKSFLAHHDGLVPVVARWCYNSFWLLNSCTPNRNFVSMATIQRPKYTLYLPYDCILYTKSNRWTSFFIASKLFAHQKAILRKSKKILSRGFSATLNLQNIKVAPKPLDRIFLNFLKKWSLMCKQVWCNKKEVHRLLFV